MIYPLCILYFAQPLIFWSGTEAVVICGGSWVTFKPSTTHPSGSDTGFHGSLITLRSNLVGCTAIRITQQPESCQYNCSSSFPHNPDIFSLFCWTQTSLFLSFSIRLTQNAEGYIPTESKVEIRNYFLAPGAAAVSAERARSWEMWLWLRATSGSCYISC